MYSIFLFQVIWHFQFFPYKNDCSLYVSKSPDFCMVKKYFLVNNSKGQIHNCIWLTHKSSERSGLPRNWLWIPDTKCHQYIRAILLSHPIGKSGIAELGMLKTLLNIWLQAVGPALSPTTAMCEQRGLLHAHCHPSQPCWVSHHCVWGGKAPANWLASKAYAYWLTGYLVNL